MRTLLLVLIVLFVSGCGGSGGGGGVVDPNTFAGDWAGTWNTASQNGTAEITVSNNGVIQGDVVNLTSDLQGTIEGSITDEGALEATLTYEGGSPITGDGTFTLSQDGNTMSGQIGNGAGAATYTLNRVN